jgi:hypothetical protein
MSSVLSHGRYITILMVSLFTTVFSGIYLGIALRAPQWGRVIGTNGILHSTSANVATQALAKLIEISFVTCFVAYIGQKLSRKALEQGSRGSSLAEMCIRNWITCALCSIDVAGSLIDFSCLRSVTLYYCCIRIR